MRFPNVNFQWLIASVLALAAIVVPFLIPSTPEQPTTTINADNNSGLITADTVYGNKTVIGKSPPAAEVAKELAKHLTGEKDEKIEQLTETIARLQQSPGDEYKQSALKKLEEQKPEEAAELLKKSLAARDKALKGQSRQMSEDWVDIGNIAFLNNTQEALSAYQKAIELDPNNLDAWNQLGHVHRRIGNLNEGIKDYEKVLDLAGDNSAWQAVAYGNLGNIYLARGELDKSEEYALKALKISEALGNQSGIANQYILLGNIYLVRGELDKAEELYLKSLKINEALGNQNDMAGAYGNLGNIYNKRGELDKSEEYILKSLKIDEALGNQSGMANQYILLGNIYNKRGELDKTEELYLKSLKISEALGNQEVMAGAYGNLGNIYNKRGELDKTEEFYLKSLKISEALGNQEVMAGAYGNLGNIYLARGELDKSEEYALKALKISEALGNQNDMAAAYGNLGSIYSSRGDPITACQHVQNSVDIFNNVGSAAAQHPQSWLNENCTQQP